MEKLLVFDMDGTIADFYGVEGWLDDLMAENPRPYIEAQPLYNMNKLRGLLELMRLDGWKIGIVSWLSKESPSSEFKKEIRRAKQYWLEEYDFPCDEVHIIKYGTNKKHICRGIYTVKVLVDDEKLNRIRWGNDETNFSLEPNEDLLINLAELYEKFYEGI